jgi:hypothetical protein
LGNDYYDSFIAYQKLLLREFARMSGEYGFKVIDASRPVRRVATALRRSVLRVIEDEPAAGVVSSAKQLSGDGPVESVKIESPEKAKSA